MTVKISFFLNDEISHYCTISNVDIEFYFVKNSLSYIAKNFKSSECVKTIYYKYLNSIAITRDSYSSKNVTHKLDKWLEDVFIPHLDYKISIKIVFYKTIFVRWFKIWKQSYAFKIQNITIICIKRKIFRVFNRTA